MEILVINLMRLGDLVQCGPVMRRLKARYPGASITLLIMDLFEEAAALVPGWDRLLTFPSGALAVSVEKPETWPHACRQLADWFAANFSPPPELVINLTPNLLGGILTFATQGHELRGLAVNQERSLYTNPAWMSYSFVVSRARLANPFNLVDLFTLGAGLTPDGLGLHLNIPSQAQSQADDVLAALNLPGDTTLIGLLPGASQRQRCWPTANFAQTAALLLAQRPCHFLIFGSAAEKTLGEEIKKFLPPGSASLFLGQTSIPMLTALLKRIHLLITNDTGPMHLAAAVGTPVLALFLASARVQDTGPVGHGHIALEPRLDCHPCLYFCPQPRCHRHLSPEVVAYWAVHLLEKRPLSTVAETPAQSHLRVYYSTFDPWGYHLHLPLVRQPLDRRHFWLWVHRAVWAQLLAAADSRWEDVLQWLTEIFTCHYLPPQFDLGLEQAVKNLQELLNLTSQGADLATQIQELADPSQSTPVRLWQKSEAIRQIDPQLRRLAVELPELSSFIEFFFQEQRANRDTAILPLAQKLQEVYGRLHQAGEICLQVVAEISKVIPDLSFDINKINIMAQGLLIESGNMCHYQKAEVRPCL